MPGRPGPFPASHGGLYCSRSLSTSSWSCGSTPLASTRSACTRPIKPSTTSSPATTAGCTSLTVPRLTRPGWSPARWAIRTCATRSPTCWRNPFTGRPVDTMAKLLAWRLAGVQDEEQEAQEAPPVRDVVREQLAGGIRRDGWLADDRYPEAGRGEGVGHRVQRPGPKTQPGGLAAHGPLSDVVV